jgi:hypothetical protein
MSDPDDKSGKNPGGVRHDSRGNAVWQWAVESGKQALDSTSRLLKRLEVPGLKLEGDTAENKQPQAAGQSKGNITGSSAKPGREAGYNPYGASRPAAATKPVAGRASRPSLWQRLFRGR